MNKPSKSRKKRRQFASQAIHSSKPAPSPVEAVDPSASHLYGYSSKSHTRYHEFEAAKLRGDLHLHRDKQQRRLRLIALAVAVLLLVGGSIVWTLSQRPEYIRLISDHASAALLTGVFSLANVMLGFALLKYTPNFSRVFFLMASLLALFGINRISHLTADPSELISAGQAPLSSREIDRILTVSWLTFGMHIAGLAISVLYPYSNGRSHEVVDDDSDDSDDNIVDNGDVVEQHG